MGCQKIKARKAASGNIESCKQQFLQNYFLQDDRHGSLEDVEAMLIEKTQVSDSIKREYYQMRTLKTQHHNDLNLESDYQLLSFLVPCTCFLPLAFLDNVRQQVFKYDPGSPMSHLLSCEDAGLYLYYYAYWF